MSRQALCEFNKKSNNILITNYICESFTKDEHFG